MQVVARQAGKQVVKQQAKKQAQKQVKKQVKKKMKEKMKKKMKEKAKKKVKDKMKKKMKEKAKKKVKDKVKKKAKDKMKQKVKDKAKDKAKNKLKKKIKEKVRDEIEDRIQEAVEDEIGDFFGRKDDIPREEFRFIEKKKPKGVQGRIDNMEYEPYFAFVVTVVLGVFMCFGMAFSKDVRCLVFLTAPQLFSSKGRTILMAYGFMLVMSGPMANLAINLDIASQSQLCSAQLAANQTKELFELATAPLAVIFNRLNDTIQEVKEVTDQIRDAFEVVQEALDSIGGITRSVYEWMKDTVKRCNEKFGKPERACYNGLLKGKRNCKKKAPKIFDWACNIVDIAKPVCGIIKVGKLLCHISGKIASFVSKGASKVIQKIKDVFYVKIELDHEFNLENNFSRSIDNITGSMAEEIKARTKQFRGLLRFTNQLLSLSFIWLFVKYESVAYGIIIEQLNTSLRMAKPEKRKFAMGLVIWCTHALYTGMIIGTDSFIHWFLTVIRKHANIKIELEKPAFVEVKVEGDGVIANVYRRLVESFESMSQLNISLDVTECLPQPKPPNVGSYETIGIIFAMTLVMVFTEAYGLRLRRFIASFYYPHRERQRVVWLYNNILKKRGGFLKYLRKQMKVRMDSSEDIEKISICDRIAANSKFWRTIFKFMGMKKKKYCVGCGKPGKPTDSSNFRQCDNRKCKSCYCLECMADLNNICLVCYMPIDIVGLDEFSEERDSSDEEEYDRLIHSKKNSRLVDEFEDDTGEYTTATDE
ncbi:DC-STAMP domain-containing protein 2-like [Anneissia japonica]|uniref:DC-STAMP domain-containing protein 2-like n=1 Tax=Anneissia japonica TaxID=1529436 RepID=UPI001425B2CE|nr:DC-STAMP domain-containing protein 2-like [Anneissia japonica]